MPSCLVYTGGGFGDDGDVGALSAEVPNLVQL